jgi:REase_MTES_1575
LNDYMRYAKSISEGHRQETNGILKSLHPHQSNKNIENIKSEQLLEELICNELQKLGYKVDLAVVHPDSPFNYILAIECDGKSSLSTEGTKERDITRQEFLEQRLDSRANLEYKLVAGSNKEIDRIHKKIQDLRKIKPAGDLITNTTLKLQLVNFRYMIFL